MKNKSLQCLFPESSVTMREITEHAVAWNFTDQKEVKGENSPGKEDNDRTYPLLPTA